MSRREHSGHVLAVVTACVLAITTILTGMQVMGMQVAGRICPLFGRSCLGRVVWVVAGNNWLGQLGLRSRSSWRPAQCMAAAAGVHSRLGGTVLTVCSGVSNGMFQWFAGCGQPYLGSWVGVC